MGARPATDAEAVAEEWVKEMRGLLTSLPEDLWRREADAFAEQGPEGYVGYAPGSQAAADVESCGARPVNLVLSRTQDALMGAADHMEAFDRALGESPRRLRVSPWTLARTVIEAEARASWMLESDDSAGEKVSRAILLSIKDTEWGLQEVAQGRITDESLAQRMEVKMQALRAPLESVAQELGLEVRYKTRFGVKTIEQVGSCKRTTISELVRRLLERFSTEPTYYPMLSEVSHQSSFAKNLADIEIMPSIIFHAIYFFSEVSWRYFTYCGLAVDGLVPILDETLGQAAIPSDKRFWERRA